MYDDIKYAVQEGIATISIDRPSVSNAFRRQTISELDDALETVRTEEGIYATILTGTGGSFCAGADVSSMPDWKSYPEQQYREYLQEVQRIVSRLRQLSKPSVAAVAGPAVGAGCDFALACDFRLLGPEAILREGFVRVGLVPGDGGAWLLPKLIGESKAREYLLTGKDITPEAALELGLAVEVADEPIESARSLLDSVLDNPALAVQRTNDLISLTGSFESHCDTAATYQWECVNDAEHEEAVTAFRERREPQFERECIDEDTDEQDHDK